MALQNSFVTVACESLLNLALGPFKSDGVQIGTRLIQMPEFEVKC